MFKVRVQFSGTLNLFSESTIWFKTQIAGRTVSPIRGAIYF